MTAMRSEQQVEAALKSYEDVDSWKTIIFLYNAALKEVGTKLEILNDEFQHVHQYNPIEHIKTRIKTPDSIVKKLKRYGHETSIENMVRYVNDIAGVRLICSFTSDIYRLAEMIGNQSDLKVLSIKDYIKNPKKNGYKSLHMIVEVPIYSSKGPLKEKVEIQLRTVAMDYWSVLEYQIFYKKTENEEVAKELKARKAKRVFAAATFGLFTNGLEKFDQAYEEGILDAVLTTNLIYQTPELLERPYYINCDMSKYIALVIDTLNHDGSISSILNPIERIQNVVNKYKNGEEI